MSNQHLFDLMREEHGLILIDSEMEDIMSAIRKDAVGVEASLLEINRWEKDSLWYAHRAGDMFWCEDVGGDFPWKVIQSGDDLRSHRYIHKNDAVVIRKSKVVVRLIQVVDEIEA